MMGEQDAEREELAKAAQLLGVPRYQLCEGCGKFILVGQGTRVMGGDYWHAACYARKRREEAGR